MTNSSSLDVDRLLDLAKEGRPLPPAALASIRHRLATGDTAEDPYSMLHILGKAKDLESETIVRRYLEFGSPDSDEDAMIRRVALQVLGRMWGLREAFPIAAAKAFEEPNSLVRAAAATILGFLGARYRDLRPQAVKLLLRGLDEETREEQEVWESFYMGLLELLQVPPQEWPLATRRLKKQDVRQDLILEARKLIADGSPGNND